MAECGHGVGKKLGFIAQEMGREINTTGSKSNQAEMQNIVVKMKDELEQIKSRFLTLFRWFNSSIAIIKSIQNKTNTQLNNMSNQLSTPSQKPLRMQKALVNY